MPACPDASQSVLDLVTNPADEAISAVGWLFSCGEAPRALQVAEILIRTGIENAELFEIAGLCARQLGQLEYAAQLWQQALERGFANAGICCNLAILSANSGRLVEAESLYRQAIKLDPGHAVALCNLGVLLAQRQQLDEAEQCYRRALVIDPYDADTLSNLGVLLADHLQDQEAAACYRQAITINPDQASAHTNLGVLLVRLGQFVEAENHQRQAVALDPSSAQAHTNLGLALEKRGQDAEAEACHRMALTLSPASAEIYSNLGALLAQSPQTEEAEQCYRIALALAPHNPIFPANLAVLLADLGRVEEAEHCLRHALAQMPESPQLRCYLGQLLLRLGRFDEGWTYHEARYNPRMSNQEKLLPDFPYPQWQGEALDGKSLLVWLEQGLGDGIQFCRYIPALKARGAYRITLVCPQPLFGLMATLAGVDQIISGDDSTTSLDGYDYWALSLSLPLHCQTTLATIPAEIPYLHAPSADMLHLGAQLPVQGFRVGLVWQGNPRHSNDRHRSLPNLGLLAPLWSIPGTCFISLQKGRGEAEARQPNPAQPLVHLGDELADLSATAAVLAQLDLLISVDTSVAHLAGALGVPCWVLLPARNTDWRWLRERSDSPWYPGMRLFRQKIPGDWPAVIEEVRGALRALCTQSAEENGLPPS